MSKLRDEFLVFESDKDLRLTVIKQQGDNSSVKVFSFLIRSHVPPES
jgi:hypothetical protein